MEEKLRTYSRLLLEECLCIKKGQPLLISFPIESYEFVRILSKTAYDLGVSDIYYDFTDETLICEALKHNDLNVLEQNPLFNKKVWDDYTLKGAGFLVLVNYSPDLMENIDSKLLADMNVYTLRSKKMYREKQMNDEISWLIAGVATKDWAEKLFPNDENPILSLWNEIFDVCGVNTDDTINYVRKKMNRLDELAKKLTDLNLYKLEYKNSLGTDLTIVLDKDAIWQSSRTKLKNGKKIICNLPSEEVYTVPNKLGTSGIVYSSKPLIYNGKKIDKFYLKFENGKVVTYDAKIGKEILTEMLNADKNSSMLGEVALVEYDSLISRKNIVFYNTLFDENASCHIALGEGYSSCIKNGNSMSKEELENKNVNKSVIHIDFMIGTNDLNIIGYSYDNKKYQIFKNGNFNIKEI